MSTYFWHVLILFFYFFVSEAKYPLNMVLSSVLAHSCFYFEKHAAEDMNVLSQKNPHFDFKKDVFNKPLSSGRRGRSRLVRVFPMMQLSS